MYYQFKKTRKFFKIDKAIMHVILETDCAY